MPMPTAQIFTYLHASTAHPWASQPGRATGCPLSKITLEKSITFLTKQSPSLRCIPVSFFMAVAQARTFAHHQGCPLRAER